jgi:hypothetical protein
MNTAPGLKLHVDYHLDRGPSRFDTVEGRVDNRAYAFHVDIWESGPVTPSADASH